MAPAGRFVAYYRVSTAQQGASGLGLEAQRQAVRTWLDGGKWQLLDEFTEVESGKVNARPELAKAINKCKVTGARLVIAKLDRLSRNAAFLLTLRDSGVRFIAADMPDATDTVVGIMAVIAQDERERISVRTKEALAAAKVRGTKLGNPNGARVLLATLAIKGNTPAVAALQEQAKRFAEDLRPIFADLELKGVTSLATVARALDAQGVQTRRGGKWTPTAVARVKSRLLEGA